MLNLFIGYDPREDEAYRVACGSASMRSSVPVAIHKLDADELYRQRLLYRPVDQRDGRMWDHLSGAAQSTTFATSRFLVPFIHRTGWSLFVDCDVVVLADLAELFALADDRYALMCVQHAPLPESGIKMDGQIQSPYARKNWSSVMLINPAHSAWNRVSVPLINHYPGDLLHRFFWLRDSEIGALPAEWNWLVGIQPKPPTPKLAHFTMGGPWLQNWRGAEHDEIWLTARDELRRAVA